MAYVRTMYVLYVGMKISACKEDIVIPRTCEFVYPTV